MINWTKTFSPNQYIDHELSGNAYTLVDWLLGYRYNACRLTFCLLSPDPTSAAKGQTISWGHSWKTYWVEGYYTSCQFRDGNSKSYGTITNHCFKVWAISYRSRDSLSITTFGGSVNDIKRPYPGHNIAPHIITMYQLPSMGWQRNTWNRSTSTRMQYLNNTFKHNEHFEYIL
jgi:hypothetical protein